MQTQQLSKTGIAEPEVFKGATRASGPRELRLALSLRGGVSLAVWIGGAVAELDRLRRSAQLDPSTSTAGVEGAFNKLCGFANYDKVSIDVITGASAGGLNGVLYTASLVYGFEFDRIAGVWIRWTDIETLSRETSGFVDQQPRSLLEGDGYFLRLVDTELTKLVDNGSGTTALDEDDPRLELLLTATLADPVNVRFSIDRFAEIVDSRRGAFFRFSHLGKVGGPFSFFGAPGSKEQAKSISQLALAARASSSFPVAFEPASVGGDGVEIQRMFSEDLTEKVEVIDGGTLDNIPVTKAIDAIAAAPAQGPTERWLVYLHPSPKIDVEHEDGSETKDGLRSTIGNMKRAASAAISQESLIDDLIELERHNVAVSDLQASREALIGQALEANVAVEDVLEPSSYWMNEAKNTWLTVEAGRIINLAERPREATINHSIPTTPIGKRWETSDYRMLRDRLYNALESATPTTTDRPSLPDLITITGTLLGWANDLQRIEISDSDLEATSEAKRTLYRIRLILETLTAVWEATWITNTGGDCPVHDDLGDRIGQWHEEALSRSEVVAADAWAAVQAQLSAADDGFHSVLHALVESTGADVANPVRVCDAIWHLLGEVARRLDDVTATVDADEVPVDVQWIRNGGASVESLRALSALLAPQVSRTALSFSRIDFARLSGANTNELSEFFGDLPMNEKLVGNETANFGAFFSAKGRANDWMWGRLDAAKTIVDVVLAGWRPNVGLVGAEKEAAVAAAVAELRAIATLPFGGDHTAAWTKWAEDRWTRADTIREEVAAQFDEPPDRDLEETKRILVGRLQAEILAAHEPWVREIDVAVEENEVARPVPVASPDELAKATAGTFQPVREFKIPDSIGPMRWASIGMRLGLVGWRALTGRGWGLVLFALKPVYLYVLAIAVQPRRALFSGMLGFGALAIGDWHSDHMIVEGLWTLTGDDPERSWQRLVALFMVYVSFGILTYLELGRRKRDVARKIERGRGDFDIGLRLAAALFIVVAATTSLWPGWVAAPGVVLIAGVIVAGLLFGFMRRVWHVVGVVLVGLTYFVLAWLAPEQVTRGWWAFLGYAIVTYGLTAAVSIWDVFRKPPRPFD